MEKPLAVTNVHTRYTKKENRFKLVKKILFYYEIYSK